MQQWNCYLFKWGELPCKHPARTRLRTLCLVKDTLALEHPTHSYIRMYVHTHIFTLVLTLLPLYLLTLHLSALLSLSTTYTFAPLPPFPLTHIYPHFSPFPPTYALHPLPPSTIHALSPFPLLYLPHLVPSRHVVDHSVVYWDMKSVSVTTQHWPATCVAM